MKFTCLQENLSKGLSVVCKAVSAKSPLPITSNVLLVTDNGRLKLSATDLATAITTYVGASVDEEGSTTVPAKVFHEFVSHLSSGTISGTLKKDILHLSSPKAKSKFNGMNSADFPKFPEIANKNTTLKLDPKLFDAAVSIISFSAAVDDSRPVLSGVLMNYADGALTIAASDGFRLSEKYFELDSDLPEFSVVVPARTLLNVAKLFSSSDDPVNFTLSKDENMALFDCNDTFVATRIIDGDYPDYKRIIPDSNALNAKFSTADLFEAVKLAHVFAKESDSIIQLTFDPEGFIELVSSSKEMGENKSEIEADIEGEAMKVAFSSKYLLDFLNNVKTEDLLFESNGSIAPGVLRSTNHENYLHIVMPVRIKD